MSSLRRCSSTLSKTVKNRRSLTPSRQHSTSSATLSQAQISISDYQNNQVHQAQLASEKGKIKLLFEKLKNKKDNGSELFFTKNHEWVQIISRSIPLPSSPVSDDNKVERIRARIGVSDFRSTISGDFIHIALDQVELKEKFYKNEELCEIDTTTDHLESMKMPISGRIIKLNDNLIEFSPLLANRSPENEGWIAEIEVCRSEDFKQLMTREQYDSYLEKVAGDYALE
jgi:glycine cleavage system H protein